MGQRPEIDVDQQHLPRGARDLNLEGLVSEQREPNVSKAGAQASERLAATRPGVGLRQSADHNNSDPGKPNSSVFIPDPADHRVESCRRNDLAQEEYHGVQAPLDVTRFSISVTTAENTADATEASPHS